MTQLRAARTEPMTPRTSTADTLDQLDPWGFAGSDTDDDRRPAVEWLDPAAAPTQLARSAAPAAPPAGSEQSIAIPSVSADAVAASPASRLIAGWRLSREAAAVLAACVVVILGQAFYITFASSTRAAAAVGHGELVVSSHPSGAQVRVDGEARGSAPLALSLAAGSHRLEIVGPDGQPQHLEVEIAAGQRLARHVALAAAVPASPLPGGLRVDTGRAVAQVSIDGVAAGATPLARADLAAGDHVVRVEFRGGAAIERRVAVPVGETVALVLEPPAARAAIPTGPPTGWLHVDAPFEVQVLARGHLVGTSAAEEILMPAGAHSLELVNTVLGYRALVSATVTAGKHATVTVDAPRVPIAVNAAPWAEVYVDGRLHGETPLANLMLPLGVHRIVLRHPELGERVEMVTVRAGGGVRVSADLRR